MNFDFTFLTSTICFASICGWWRFERAFLFSLFDFTLFFSFFWLSLRVLILSWSFETLGHICKTANSLRKILRFLFTQRCTPMSLCTDWNVIIGFIRHGFIFCSAPKTFWLMKFRSKCVSIQDSLQKISVTLSVSNCVVVALQMRCNMRFPHKCEPFSWKFKLFLLNLAVKVRRRIESVTYQRDNNNKLTI